VLYDRLETAEMVGLAPQTLANYTRPGYSDLIRGADFVVRRITHGLYLRRKLYFTDRGLARLLARDYKVFRPGEPSPAQKAFWGRAASHRSIRSAATGRRDLSWLRGDCRSASNAIPSAADKNDDRPLETYSNQERRMRLKDQTARAFLRYLDLGGCALPACPCMIHSILKVPQADYLAALLPPKKK
jgi:hypothetical protein